MVDNKGNLYRTNGAITGAIVLIGFAVAMIVYFATDAGIIPSAGVFLLIMGAAIVAMSTRYSSAPDKFGPGEGDYRRVAGAILIVAGAIMIASKADLDWYWYVAFFIIAVAVIVIAAALNSSRKINNE